MVAALLSVLIAGFASFAMICLFLALVPRLAGDGKSVSSALIQWLLIASVVMPAIAVAFYGPIWLYQVVFSRATTEDQRVWLILAGIGLLAVCMFGAFRTPAGKRYSRWRSRVG
jgi:hypothetical protein